MIYVELPIKSTWKAFSARGDDDGGVDQVCTHTQLVPWSTRAIAILALVRMVKLPVLKNPKVP